MKVVAFGNGRTLSKQILEAIKENTMNSVTTIYKVYGCNEEGKPILNSEFWDFREACHYAVAQHGKIHLYIQHLKMQEQHYQDDLLFLLQSQGSHRR